MKMTAQVYARVTPLERAAFHKKCADFGGASVVMREMVQAFLENRMIIQPPKKGTLYDLK